MAHAWFAPLETIGDGSGTSVGLVVVVGMNDGAVVESLDEDLHRRCGGTSR